MPGAVLGEELLRPLPEGLVRAEMHVASNAQQPAHSSGLVTMIYCEALSVVRSLTTDGAYTALKAEELVVLLRRDSVLSHMPVTPVSCVGSATVVC